MLSLKLFGSGQAMYDDRLLTGFPLQNPCLLLCYLVLNRRLPHQRDRLAAIFWADRPSYTARKCLRHVLWRLRQTMEAAGAIPEHYLSIEDETVAFLPLVSYELDVEFFETAILSVQRVSGEKLTPYQAENIEKAVSLYSGDLLQDLDASWCLHDREYLRLMYMNSLEKLMIYHASHENYERSLEHGMQILAQDNTREAIHQHIMRLHWVSGNRCAAAAQYKSCAQILQDEMGIDPMEQTKQLYELILQSELPPVNRWVFHEIPAYSQMTSTESSSSCTHQLLQHIHHLQLVVEQSSQELGSLEKLVSQLLLDAKQS